MDLTDVLLEEDYSVWEELQETYASLARKRFYNHVDKCDKCKSISQICDHGGTLKRKWSVDSYAAALCVKDDNQFLSHLMGRIPMDIRFDVLQKVQEIRRDLGHKSVLTLKVTERRIMRDKAGEPIRNKDGKIQTEGVD